MITQRELDELRAATPADEPLFDSLHAMCLAFGLDAETESRIRREQEWTWQTSKDRLTGRG